MCKVRKTISNSIGSSLDVSPRRNCDGKEPVSVLGLGDGCVCGRSSGGGHWCEKQNDELVIARPTDRYIETPIDCLVVDDVSDSLYCLYRSTVIKTTSTTLQFTEKTYEKKMSLEAKFAALSIDDAASVVEAVKKDGVQKSGLADNIATLTAKCASSNDDEALAALKTVKALAEECPEAQAFTKECLTACKYTTGPHFLLITVGTGAYEWVNQSGRTTRPR